MGARGGFAEGPAEGGLGGAQHGFDVAPTVEDPDNLNLVLPDAKDDCGPPLETKQSQARPEVGPKRPALGKVSQGVTCLLDPIQIPACDARAGCAGDEIMDSQQVPAR